MFIPIQNSTHYSLLNSISKPETLVNKAKELNYQAVGLVDYHSLSGSVEFQNECKKTKIKPIIGTKLRIDNESYITLIAKNLIGWKTLCKMISKSNDPENMYNGIAILKQEHLKDFDLKDLILILGDLESELFHQCFSLHGFAAKDLNSAALGLSGDVENKVENYIRNYYSLFNRDNIFIQLNNISNNELPYGKLITDILRAVANKENLKCIAGVNSHYINKGDVLDHRLLMCSDQKSTFNKIDMSWWKNNVFFGSDKFHLPSIEEITSIYTQEEIANTEFLSSQCEEYSVTNKPQLPMFPTPNGVSEIEYLRQLARDGYAKKYKDWDKQIYGDRAKLELQTIEEAELPGYFLIVQDYVNHFKKQGRLIGHGRGSVAGSLIAYLTSITEVDPIPYELLFERFYNKGRNTDGNISYPDIDMDFPIEIKDEAINYVKNMYGLDRVSQICTYGRLQGRSSLREVFRVYEVFDINTINQISKRLPEQHKVADKMEEDEEESIIKWTLINKPELLEQYCTLDNDGKCAGELAQYFEQAIRIEGVYKSIGCHAAGVVISKHPLDEVSPMVWNDGVKGKITAFEMKSLEKAGLVKFDFLGNAGLSKLDYVKTLLRG